MIRSLTNILIQATLWLAASWLIYHSTHITFGNNVDGTEYFRACFVHGIAFNALIFFAVLYLFGKSEDRWSPAFLGSCLLLFVGVTLMELYVDDLMLGDAGYGADLALLPEFRRIMAGGNLVVLAAALFTGLAMDWFHQHQLARQVREQQIKTELDLLKSRINPHFLFNVLNSIFYTAQKNGDQETADAIARLSDMMRYMLHEVSAERVPLANELDYLDNYVAMQRMRLAEIIPIDFSVSGEPGSVTVPPMILLPFVENTFKHGVSNAHPTPIRIEINIKEGQLVLTTHNHVHSAKTEPPGGFGLENVRRRLDLLFPGKYRLDIDQSDGCYAVRLSLETVANATKEANTREWVLKEGDI